MLWQLKIESSSNEHFFMTNVSIPWEENVICDANVFNLGKCFFFTKDACLQKRRENKISELTISRNYFVCWIALCAETKNLKAVGNIFV